MWSYTLIYFYNVEIICPEAQCLCTLSDFLTRCIRKWSFLCFRLLVMPLLTLLEYCFNKFYFPPFACLGFSHFSGLSYLWFFWPCHMFFPASVYFHTNCCAYQEFPFIIFLLQGSALASFPMWLAALFLHSHNCLSVLHQVTLSFLEKGTIPLYSQNLPPCLVLSRYPINVSGRKIYK